MLVPKSVRVCDRYLLFILKSFRLYFRRFYMLVYLSHEKQSVEATVLRLVLIAMSNIGYQLHRGYRHTGIGIE